MPRFCNRMRSGVLEGYGSVVAGNRSGAIFLEDGLQFIRDLIERLDAADLRATPVSIFLQGAVNSFRVIKLFGKLAASLTIVLVFLVMGSLNPWKNLKVYPVKPTPFWIYLIC